MSNRGAVRLVRGEDLRLAAGQTPGMVRREAFSDDETWVGVVTSEPNMASGWHHHGQFESYIHVMEGRFRMESGPGGRDLVEAHRGDFLRVPRWAIHRESNPDPTPGRFVIVRVGSGVPVVNVDGPATESSEP